VFRALDAPSLEACAAAAEIAARTDDPARDISDEGRARMVEWFERSGAPGVAVRLVRDGVTADAARPVLYYGEPLPQGLRLGLDS
jgi:hypothetical protein